jgi:hypothetical protein
MEIRRKMSLCKKCNFGKKYRVGYVLTIKKEGLDEKSSSKVSGGGNGVVA